MRRQPNSGPEVQRQETDEGIDLSDLPEIPPEMFARAIVRKSCKPIERKLESGIPTAGEDAGAPRAISGGE